MANNSTGRKPSGNSQRKTAGNTSGRKNQSNKTRKKSDAELLIINYSVIVLSVFFCVLLFLCNFGKVGKLGEIVSLVMFGAFGWNAYVFPVFLVFIAFLWISKQANERNNLKLISVMVIFLCLGVVIELRNGYSESHDIYDIKEIMRYGYEQNIGGGLISGSVAFAMKKLIDAPVTIVLNIILMIIGVFIIFSDAIVSAVTSGSRDIKDTAREAREYRDEQRLRKEESLNAEARIREEKKELARQRKEDAQRRKNEAQQKKEEALANERENRQRMEDEGILRMDKKVKGVSFDTDLKENAIKKRDDMHEIVLKDNEEPASLKERVIAKDNSPIAREIRIHTADYDDGTEEIGEIQAEKEIIKPQAPSPQPVQRPVAKPVKNEETVDNAVSIAKPLSNAKYKFPPLTLLAGGGKKASSSRNELHDTALKLEEALESFGIAAKVLDISQGPSVTRYELEPPPGCKVSRITTLADDLKLHLAAKDIRIEAPVPGKSVVGIEVPNQESSGVKLRELLEDPAIKNFSGNIAFGVGKDIAGKVIAADISKMPHMLIAGSTGSGKSVCINTIIMSIIYKHDPKDVQLIMVDPKVVELNVYNGIPHLMIPVVTDPKKAAGALHWAVEEMTDRYKKFAELSVRDLKGYNAKVDQMSGTAEGELHKHLPQIVIIVDELADLMMVAAKEVEESICRLAQLARACGIHLILATQRPSVDVITGLIKANMPSRIAFAVSSSIDSRTILDMNGAEKLLGKGDMLFYPQGYTKPVRVQGAFVSDEEVSAVVDFVKNQRLHNEFGEEAAAGVERVGSGSGSGSLAGSGDNGSSQYDELFVTAGQFIIDSGKASIGNLQRKFRIGFNRAARIMDQLCEAGVVSEENGTKPRDVLMGPEEFEQYIDEYNV